MHTVDVDTHTEARRAWIGLAVLALPTLLISIDVSVLYVALPSLSSDLGASGVHQLWILDIYSFLLAGLLVTMGGLADRIGSRRMLIVGGAAFGVFSVLAAYSTSPEMLIASRALLGVAGASLMPATMALIRHMFPEPEKMAVAISVWLACFMGGMTAGPIVGGFLMERLWWGSAFLMGVPVMVLLVALAPRLLPDQPRTAGRALPDAPSVVLSLATLLPVVYGLKEIARGHGGVLAGIAVVAGVAAGVAFCRRQRRLEDPLVDLGLFENRRFTVGLATFLVTGVVMAGVSFAAALYLQNVLGLSPLHVGLWLVPQNLVMLAGTLLAPRLDRRFDTVKLVWGGLAVAGTGLLMLTIVDTDALGIHVVAMVLAAGGVSAPMSLVMNLIMGATPPERAGSAASLAETCGELGIALGVATLGSLLTAIYHGVLPGLLPADTSTVAAQAAGEGISSASAVSSPGVLDAARAAFTEGYNIVGLVGGLTLLVAAFVARRVLGAREPVDADETSYAEEPVAA
ncbi:MFS transporter [Nocardioides sp. LHG3406-4]|uniref:MFS transporter n=1 Tax=Nocardioides sp. LHG3406-4 TaxID=2804575 RepID=UPI003CF9BC66